MALNFEAVEAFKSEFVDWSYEQQNDRIPALLRPNLSEPFSELRLIAQLNISDLSSRRALLFPVWPKHHIPFLLAGFGDVESIESLIRLSSSRALPAPQRLRNKFSAWAGFIEVVKAIEAMLNRAIRAGTISEVTLDYCNKQTPGCDRDSILCWAQLAIPNCPILVAAPKIQSDAVAERNEQICTENFRLKALGETGVIKKLAKHFGVTDDVITSVIYGKKKKGKSDR